MKLLGQKFPTWRVFTFNDLTAEEQGMWRQAPWKNECPGIAVGHFEAKDRNTYAVVLVPKNNNKASFRLIVMNGRGRTYTVKVLEQSNEVYGPVVYTIPPGDHQYYDNDERKQIHLSLDGFQVEWMARVANLYYWKDGKYESVSVMF